MTSAKVLRCIQVSKIVLNTTDDFSRLDPVSFRPTVHRHTPLPEKRYITSGLYLLPSGLAKSGRSKYTPSFTDRTLGDPRNLNVISVKALTSWEESSRNR